MGNVILGKAIPNPKELAKEASSTKRHSTDSVI